MTILDEIISHKKQEISEIQSRIPLSDLKSMDREFPEVNFLRSLTSADISIIAEVKRRSPSMGDIQPTANPITVASEFQNNGAAAISVLTDGKYFGGSLDFLKQIKAQVDIPVLRKDFIISEYQIYESRVIGADAILLIADSLDASQLADYYSLATEEGLGVLMEIHSLKYLQVLHDIQPGILGVNSRNLETMEVEINWFKELFHQLPKDAVKVAESGIQKSADLKFVSELGYDAVLIGTALMQSESPGEKLKQLLEEHAK